VFYKLQKSYPIVDRHQFQVLRGTNDPCHHIAGRGRSKELELQTSTGRPYLFRRFGLARFALSGIDFELPVYWLEGYGGGLFLPFADRTSGKTTYGAGRYLLDTVKGADLGTADGRLVLDFNFAYNPSCVYDPAWTCPLAPAANRLGVDVRAGERADG